MQREDIIEGKSSLVESYSNQGKMAYGVSYLEDFQILTTKENSRSVFSGITENIFVVRTVNDKGNEILEIYTQMQDPETKKNEMVKIGTVNEKGELVLEETYLSRLENNPLFSDTIKQQQFKTPSREDIELQIKKEQEKDVDLDPKTGKQGDPDQEDPDQDEPEQDDSEQVSPDDMEEDPEIDISDPDAEAQIASAKLSSNIRFSFNPNERLMGQTFNQILHKNYVKVEAIPVKGSKYNMALVGVTPSGDQELISELQEIDRNYNTYRMDDEGKIVKSNSNALFQVANQPVVFNISYLSGVPSLGAGKMTTDSEVLTEQVNTSNQRRPDAEQDRYFKTVTSAEIYDTVNKIEEQEQEGTTVHYSNVDKSSENDVLIDPYNEKIKGHDGEEHTLEEFWEASYKEHISFDEYLATVVAATGDCWPEKIADAHEKLDAEFNIEREDEEDTEHDHGDRGERKAPWEDDETVE